MAGIRSGIRYADIQKSGSSGRRSGTRFAHFPQQPPREFPVPSEPQYSTLTLQSVLEDWAATLSDRGLPAATYPWA